MLEINKFRTNRQICGESICILGSLRLLWQKPFLEKVLSVDKVLSVLSRSLAVCDRPPLPQVTLRQLVLHSLNIFCGKDPFQIKSPLSFLIHEMYKTHPNLHDAHLCSHTNYGKVRLSFCAASTEHTLLVYFGNIWNQFLCQHSADEPQQKFLVRGEQMDSLIKTPKKVQKRIIYESVEGLQ